LQQLSVAEAIAQSRFHPKLAEVDCVAVDDCTPP
jgi:hypothetical protein